MNATARMAVASRDERGFEFLEVTVIDPWQGG
jgi:hypothetical protein